MAKKDLDNFLSAVLPWLLSAVAVIAPVLTILCVRAEKRSDWYVAQGACGVILFLLFLAGGAVWEWWGQDHRAAAMPLSPEFETYAKALHKLLCFVAVGIFAVMLNAIRYQHWTVGIVAKSASVGILLAGAAFIIGALFGFLFGFPPAPTLSQSPENKPAALSPFRASSTAPFYANSNLREISDWLTKVIVGASLVTLAKFPLLLWRLANFIAYGMNPTEPSPPVALALLGYFSSCGFLYGYIWTKYEVTATSQRSNYDALALTAVEDWLYRPPTPNDDPGPMMDAIKAASSAARVRIFLETDRYRTPSSEDRKKERSKRRTDFSGRLEQGPTSADRRHQDSRYVSGAGLARIRAGAGGVQDPSRSRV